MREFAFSGLVCLAILFAPQLVRSEGEPPSRSSVLIQEVRAGDVTAEQKVEATEPPFVTVPRTEFLNLFGSIPFGWARLEGSVDARGDLLAPVLRGYAEARLDGARLFGRHNVDFYVDAEASGREPGSLAELDLAASLAGLITIQGLVPNFDQGYARVTGRVLEKGAGVEGNDLRLGWHQLQYVQFRLNPPNPDGLPEFLAWGEQRSDGGVVALPFGGGAFSSGERVVLVEVPVGEDLRFEVELETGAADFNRGLSKADLLSTARVALRPGPANPDLVLGIGAVPVPEAGIWLAVVAGCGWAFARRVRRGGGLLAVRA